MKLYNCINEFLLYMIWLYESASLLFFLLMTEFLLWIKDNFGIIFINKIVFNKIISGTFLYKGCIWNIREQ